MKLKPIVHLFVILVLSIMGCSKSDQVQTLFEPVKLLGPVEDSEIELDLYNTKGVVIFEWSALPNANDQTKYSVLFDYEGTKFEMPAESLLSDNEGKSTKLTLTHETLDLVAEKVGIAAKKMGAIKWAVDASTGERIITSVAGRLVVKRPSGLGIVPGQLFLTGIATEGGPDLQAAIPFKKLRNGLFELISALKAGTYKLVSDQSSDAIAYYFENGELFRGEKEMNFDAPEAPALIRVDFNNTVGIEKVILAVEMIVTATHATVAKLEYSGNHVLENKNAVFNFLKPGAPGAPDWLSWVEERYKFRFKTNQGDEYYGSPMNADMNASSDPLYTVFNQRPDGAEPKGYLNIYQVDANDFWAGCFKMASRFDGQGMSIKLDFNPVQYQHSFALN